MKNELIKQVCISCEAEFLGSEPSLCCSGSDCGCRGLPIEPPLCEKCEDKFFWQQSAIDRGEK